MFLLAVHKFDTGDHPVLGELSMAFTRSFLLVLGLRRLLGTFNPMMKKPSNYGGFIRYRKLSGFLRFATYCDFPQIDWQEDFLLNPQCSEKNPSVSAGFSDRLVLDVLVGGKVQRPEESGLNFQTRPRNAGGTLHQTCTDFRRWRLPKRSMLGDALNFFGCKRVVCLEILQPTQHAFKSKKFPNKISNFQRGSKLWWRQIQKGGTSLPCFPWKVDKTSVYL